MADSSDQLKMIASLSDPHEWADQGHPKAANQLGIQPTKSHALALHDLRRQVGDVSERMKAGLRPALEGVGIRTYCRSSRGL